MTATLVSAFLLVLLCSSSDVSAFNPRAIWGPEQRFLGAISSSRWKNSYTTMSARDPSTYLHKAAAAAAAALQIFSIGAPAIASGVNDRGLGHGGTFVAESLFGGKATDSSGMSEPPPAPRKAPSGPFEETWAKSNEFFFDRTHRGNDWDAVRTRLKADIAAGKKSEVQATNEMLGLLKDKYTRLVDPEYYDALSKYDLIGVGLMLSPNPEGQLAVSSTPKAKSQAEGFGVKKGDLVMSINGIKTSGVESFDVVDFLAKYEGKTVTLEFRGIDDTETRTLELERTFPEVKDPLVYALKDQGEHKIGYARLREFNSIGIKRLGEVLSEMKAGGADEFVLDLRGNGGGALQSALGIAGLFMDDKPLAYVVDGAGARAEFKSKTGAIVPDAPLVLWVDGLTASASEVLAGALQDDCRAILRGNKTFGKGLVQAVYGLSDGSGLIMTVAQYETPRGTYIQDKGIMPDIRGGLPMKMLSGALDFDQAQFDMARERMKSCPPVTERLNVVGAAGAPSSS